jgi:threonine/homoserine/homoserine lactone efflux protein
MTEVVFPVWSYLILGCGFAFAAAVQPGPFQTFLISETMSRGWRRTVPAAFAPLVSDAPIILISLFILKQIPHEMIRILHLAGSAFLFYLAWGAWKSWREFDVDMPVKVATGRDTLIKAALVNFLNPNPWLAWALVLGPLLLEGYREAPGHGVALLLGFYVTMTACLVGIIVLFAFARSFGPTVRKSTLGFSVLALAGFGGYQLWLGIAFFSGGAG